MRTYTIVAISYPNYEGITVLTRQRAFKEAIPAVLLVMIIVMFSNFSRAVMSPLLVNIAEEFQLTAGPASRLYLIISIFFSASLLSSGYISSKISHRLTILCSAMVLFLALVIIGLSVHIRMLHVGMALVGIGAGLYPASGLSLLNSLVHDQDRQKAISLHEIGPNLAMLLAPLFANLFLSLSSWRMAYAVLGVTTLVSGLVFYYRIDGGYERGHPPTRAVLFQLLRNPSFLLMTLLIGLGISSIQGVYALLPMYLVHEVGMDPQRANSIFALSRIAPLISLMTLGWLPGRIGIRRSVRLFLLLAGLFTMLIGIGHGSILILLVILQPAAGALIVPSALGGIQDINRETSVSVIFSFMLPISTLIATGIVPTFLGFMGDYVSFSAGFVIFGFVLMVMGLVAVYGIAQEKTVT